MLGLSLLLLVSTDGVAHAGPSTSLTASNCPAAPRARTATSFNDSVGVATHLRYGDTPYGDFPAVRQKLLNLGVHHIRDGWNTGDAELAADAASLASRGIHLTFVHDPRDGGTPESQQRGVQQRLLGSVEAAESLNEPDAQGRSWMLPALDWTKRLAQAYRSSPSTASTPIIAPALADSVASEPFRSLSTLRGVVDYGNIHDYPGDQLFMTDSVVDRVLANTRLAVGDKPVVATETGYSDGTGGTPYPVMSQSRVAKAMSRLVLEHYCRGISRTFLYELWDERANRSFEGNFGLLEHDGTPKPSYLALRSLLQATTTDQATDQAPLEWSLAGADPSVRALALRGADHQWLLVFWRQLNRFSRASSSPVTLRTGGQRSVSLTYTTKPGLRPELHPSGTASFSLDDDVVVARVDPR